MPRLPDQERADAQIAKAESLVSQRKYGDAEALIKGVIKAAPAEDAATQSAAHNTLGACLRAAGRPKEALYAYLHTDMLFSKEKDEHARALAQIAQLWRDPQLNRPDRAEEGEWNVVAQAGISPEPLPQRLCKK